MEVPVSAAPPGHCHRPPEAGRRVSCFSLCKARALGWLPPTNASSDSDNEGGHDRNLGGRLGRVQAVP